MTVSRKQRLDALWTMFLMRRHVDALWTTFLMKRHVDALWTTFLTKLYPAALLTFSMKQRLHAVRTVLMKRRLDVVSMMVSSMPQRLHAVLMALMKQRLDVVSMTVSMPRMNETENKTDVLERRLQASGGKDEILQNVEEIKEIKTILSGIEKKVDISELDNKDNRNSIAENKDKTLEVLTSCSILDLI
ncbi:UNVERIFIED_CONTAM: hypothetical protein K2H54_005961 [Gekko kuhli]